MVALNVSGNKLLAKKLLAMLGIGIVTAAYVQSTLRVKNLPPYKAAEEINIAVSPAVQILLSAGDPFLAADLAVFRATFVGVQELNPADYSILAKVQEDASFLNPAQEDNYYIAQGVLPWIGEYDTANTILKRATAVRPFDFMPPYFLGFNYMYFVGNFEEAGRYYQLSADRLEGKNRDILLSYAAKFMEKGNDPVNAIHFINGLIKSTRNPGLQNFLRARIVRLERLIILREAATKYQEKFLHTPRHLNDLVDSGILNTLPSDPLGVGYKLDEHGVPQIIFHIPKQGQR